MYDPTWVPYNNDIWSSSETEQHYLVGTPEGETLSRIRYSPPGGIAAEGDATRPSSIDDGTLTGTFRLDGAGAMDSRLRRLVNGHAASRNWTPAAPGCWPRSARGSRTSRPAITRSTTSAATCGWRSTTAFPASSSRIDGGFEFTSPLMQVVLSATATCSAPAVATWAEERETDLLLWYTQLLDAEETIKCPGLASWPKLPDAERGRRDLRRLQRHRSSRRAASWS